MLRYRSLPCSELDWRVIQASVLNFFFLLTEKIEITDLEKPDFLVKACLFGLHIDNLLLKGFSHFKTAHRITNSAKAETVNPGLSYN